MSNEQQKILDETETASGMSAEEWNELIRKHEASQRETKTIHKAETAAECQVRSMVYEQQIPDLPDAVQRRWDAWADARITAIVEAALDQAAEEIHRQNVVNDKITDEAILALRAENKSLVDEIAKMKRDLATKLTKMRKDFGARGSNVVDLPNPIKQRQ
jgi:hypothetical protein